MKTKNWKWFRYDEIFEIKKGKRLTLAEQEKGVIPYISSSSVNNAVDNYINNGYTDDNCISFACYGSIGEVFYQKGKVWVSDNANVFYLRHFVLNKYIAMFLISIINKEKYRFSYGVTGKKERLDFFKIKLPAIQNENDEYIPDWQWIENYVKETIIPQLPPKSKLVWQQQFDKTPLSNKKLELNVEDWKWFRIGDLFDVVAGKYHYPSEYSDGETPYLSATVVNNGIGQTIDLDAEFEGNIITTEKVKCTSYYQPKPFCATSDVNIIKSRNNEFNKYIGLFLASIIDFNENYRWCYGRQCRVGDTKNITIKLPAIKTVNGEYEPDWQWMEDYIKGLPYSEAI